MNERTDGWYWVKLEDSDGWIPWEWRSSSRSPQGAWFNSETPIEVGPRIPSPDEPWRCVPTRTPTIDMTEAGMSEVMRGQDYERAQRCWNAMLAAAPKPEDS